MCRYVALAKPDIDWALNMSVDQRWFEAGLPSTALAQHRNNIVQKIVFANYTCRPHVTLQIWHHCPTNTYIDPMSI